MNRINFGRIPNSVILSGITISAIGFEMLYNVFHNPGAIIVNVGAVTTLSGVIAKSLTSEGTSSE